MQAARFALAVLATTGCQAIFPLTPPPLGADASIDATPVDAQQCFGMSGALVEFCLDAEPAGALVLGTTTIITHSDSICAPSESPAAKLCIVAARSIEITGTVRAIGDRPLVLFSSTTISVAQGASIDVSSLPLTPGAGSGPGSPSCPTTSPATGRLGGAGGSFGGEGGVGGTALGVLGTMPPPSFTPVLLHGGCPGTPGASSAAGRGGGAVYLAAAQSITVLGTINASGSGGRGGLNDTGGGGGGAGGMIVLDAPQIMTGSSTQIFANGGGGGGGSGTDVRGGTGGVSDAPDAPGAGGKGVALTDGDGGAGSARPAMTDGARGTGDRTGGGVGVFRVLRGTLPPDGVIWPPAS